jgi:hypothetical protein
MPLKEIDGSSCCVSNNFGPKFNNEKRQMLSKESGKKKPPTCTKSTMQNKMECFVTNFLF